VPARRGPGGRVLVALAAASVLICSVLVTGHLLNPATPPGTKAEKQRGPLAFQAPLDTTGAGFSDRWVLGDPSASAIRFSDGAVAYAVLAADGKTGNAVAVAPLSAYVAEFVLSAEPRSSVIFWFDFATGNPQDPVGQHLLYLDTKAESLRLAYFMEGQPIEYIGPVVPISGFRGGRRIAISALVNPPQYRIALDGATVIDVQHQPSPPRQSPTLAVFGNGTGAIRLTSLRIYEWH